MYVNISHDHTCTHSRLKTYWWTLAHTCKLKYSTNWTGIIQKTS